MLFVSINFPRLAGKDVTSWDSCLEVVAHTKHFRVWSEAQASLVPEVKFNQTEAVKSRNF